jgi:hypothetical protein
MSLNISLRIKFQIQKHSFLSFEASLELGYANQISISKKQLLVAAPAAFSNGKDKDAEQKEVERDNLYQKVGKLQIGVDWLKKDRLSGMSVSEKGA